MPIQGGKTRSVKVGEIFVTLHWVPGHIGVEVNEKIDELGRKGALTPLVVPEHFRGLGEAYP